MSTDGGGLRDCGGETWHSEITLEIQRRSGGGGTAAQTLPSLLSGWGAEERGQSAQEGQLALKGCHMQYAALVLSEPQERQVIASERLCSRGAPGPRGSRRKRPGLTLRLPKS